MDPNDSLIQALIEDGIVDARNVVATPLAGGVSCDVLKVDSGGKSFVVKRALAQLRVKDKWVADVERNRYEHLYLSTVTDFLPRHVPKVLFVNDEKGYFCMEWLGDGWKTWKTDLLEGNFFLSHAKEVGRILGRIHQETFGRNDLLQIFDTTDNFIKLRLDAYLLTTGRRHSELESFFVEEVERIKRTRTCLIHGDFSPKNLLIHNDRVVVLDCEVAWFGDPSFDLAFVLNHLLLKMLYHAPAMTSLKKLFDATVDSYFQERKLSLADIEEFQQTTTHLLSMLMLARVDGKSPVEYLIGSPLKQNFIREFVTNYLVSGASLDLKAFADVWEMSLYRTRRFSS